MCWLPQMKGTIRGGVWKDIYFTELWRIDGDILTTACLFHINRQRYQCFCEVIKLGLHPHNNKSLTQANSKPCISRNSRHALITQMWKDDVWIFQDTLLHATVPTSQLDMKILLDKLFYPWYMLHGCESQSSCLLIYTLEKRCWN